jgi:hypothetical protein
MQTPINDDKCTICLENFDNKIITTLNCGHVYCIDCINQLIENRGSNVLKCPLCRVKIESYTENNFINKLLYIARNNNSLRANNNTCVSNIPIYIFTTIVLGISMFTSMENSYLNEEINDLLNNCSSFILK